MPDSARVAPHRLLQLALLAVLSACAAPPRAERDYGVLLPNTRWATPVYTIAGPERGPTVLVTGGIHGDEPAGAEAAEAIRSWEILRGTLVVVPRCNVPALALGQRRMPGIEPDQSDLNRCFPRTGDGPGDETSAPLGALATALWALVRRVEPDWILDLHEGFDFNQENPKSVGSTVLTSRVGDGPEHAARMLTVLNETIPVKRRKFVLKFSQATGSLAHSAATALGVRTMIVETTKKDLELAARVEQHVTLVRAHLANLGMVEPVGEGLGVAPAPPQIRR